MRCVYKFIGGGAGRSWWEDLFNFKCAKKRSDTRWTVQLSQAPSDHGGERLEGYAKCKRNRAGVAVSVTASA